jgi:hypothetical protein
MFDYHEKGRRAAWWSCLYLRCKPDISLPAVNTTRFDLLSASIDILTAEIRQ